MIHQFNNADWGVRPCSWTRAWLAGEGDNPDLRCQGSATTAFESLHSSEHEKELGSTPNSVSYSFDYLEQAPFFASVSLI